MRDCDFVEIILRNPVNAKILAGMSSLDLSDAWLVSGCLFQTVWNHLTGRPIGHGIKDYDLFYFDRADLSWAAEDQVNRQVSKELADLEAVIEVRNQARVHLWYENRFGRPYPPLSSACDGIDRFLERTSKVGIRPLAAGGFQLYAPEGLDHISTMTVAPDRNTPHFSEAHYQEKVVRWQRCWPELTVVDEPHGPQS